MRNIVVKDKSKKLSRKPSVVHINTLGIKKAREIQVEDFAPRNLKSDAHLKSR
jgi:hypothetical protein